MSATDTTTENGSGSVKTIFGIPCKGCTERSRIMGAGDWQTDAILIGAILLLGIAIYLAKRENSG
jgi:hypothetical protein